jgi:Gly-Xaa carboxypeptidase
MGDIKLGDSESVLPLANTPNAAPRKTPRTVAVLTLLVVFLCLSQSSLPAPKFWSSCHRHFPALTSTDLAQLSAAKCPAQPRALNVGTDWDPLHDEAYAELAARRLSQAVQHETISYDDFGSLPANDTALDKHYAFADWMYNEYPKVFTTLKHEVVNVHGQLLTWVGSNKALQPIILMAHTDVVPVAPDTLEAWTYPPFEGKVVVNATKDTPGTWIWGRGASDCKNQLMGILGATERLVSEGFVPERTIIIASGFDEEVGATSGAS